MTNERNEHTDTDFLKLSKRVDAGFRENDKAHAEVLEMAKDAKSDTEALGLLVSELRKGNHLMRKTLFGNGGVGIVEEQRSILAFLKGFKRLIWIAATVATVSFVGGVIAFTKHMIETN